MRQNRIGFAVLAGLSALALSTAAQAAPYEAPAAAGAGAGPAAGRLVVDLDSPSQLPHAGQSGPPVFTQAAPMVTYRTPAFTNNHGGKCLDGDLNTINYDGAKVQLWGCNGWDNQSWYWTPAPGLPVGYYTIQNGHGWKCLDGDLNTINYDGAKVQLWGCNGWDNQTWVWSGSTLQNYHGWKCLDGDLNTINYDGAKVQLWGCNGWDNQSWTWH
ncbi:RICIN domain-containing protein [Streptomyces kaniharaensis]|uniref:RICIN domain-containing protein n=1 Tax=Streptomyces kaniharaensis TaxID=212423 RepID=A0A6N7KZ58_9ACTN|nr:RICIN domain-containing protein [Streptomyces kaniharaensis]MQS16711.1 RICIN domain-containing protein [Streptomyces kaniharaensis]